MKVHVHAWEYVNVAIGYPRRAIDAGGGGFDFFADGLLASAAFKKGIAQRLNTSPHNTADFLFAFTVQREDATPEQITAEIDAQLIELCASANVRRVGENVLTYWRRNKFKMGSATRAARKIKR